MSDDGKIQGAIGYLRLYQKHSLDAMTVCDAYEALLKLPRQFTDEQWAYFVEERTMQDPGRVRKIYGTKINHPRRVGKWVFFRSICIEMRDWLKALDLSPVEEGARPSISECLKRIDLIVEEQNLATREQQHEREK
jgi:hypothetical protein